jgi:hypothetical protein
MERPENFYLKKKNKNVRAAAYSNEMKNKNPIPIVSIV